MTTTSLSQGMFAVETLLGAVQGRLRKQLDANQLQAVEADSDASLFLVAGPGSGKTTVLTLRVLKLIFVDEIDPASILATTFTRKAASELRSRILGWGDALRSALKAGATPRQAAWLARLDLNRVFTGTLDSIAEQVLRDFRSASSSAPVVLDEFVARALLFRKGVLETGAWENTSLKAYLGALCSDGRVGTRTMGGLIGEVRQRLIHDLVDLRSFRASQPAEAHDLLEAIDAYEQELARQQALDFALLEQTFLSRLQNGSLQRFLDPLRIVLVDEYQDTNQLQEAIYFTLARAARQNGGAISVVGDDDQSLYRFRGATVDLFRDFAARLSAQTGISAQTIYLSSNYRSTPTIVGYCASYLGHDSPYTSARVTGKPPLAAGRVGGVRYPVLTLFREDRETLARDLAAFVRDVVGGGRAVHTPGGALTIRTDPRAGAIGDLALLCSSPREYNSTGKPRLPLLLREALLPRYQVFNARGQEFSEIESVARICGLLLECIDPEGVVQSDLAARHRLPEEVHATLGGWRDAAQQYMANNPPAPGRPRHTLADFVAAWQRRSPQSSSVKTWPDSVPLIKLLYDLITWVPEMQDDAEGLVYLEAITRTITQSARFSSFDAEIRSDVTFGSKSVAAAILDILAPLAAGDIDVDEELFTATPRDRLSVLSIHQAKGLEFPLVIVDVGSDFTTNNHAQRFKRHPHSPGRSHALEDALHPHSPLRAPLRPAIDRAFDDLLRQYFVAFSRPQDVLVLVGLCDGTTKQPSKRIANMALGWDRYDATSGGARWPITRGIVAI